MISGVAIILMMPLVFFLCVWIHDQITRHRNNPAKEEKEDNRFQAGPEEIKAAFLGVIMYLFAHPGIIIFLILVGIIVSF